MTEAVDGAFGFDDIRAAHLPVIQALAMNPEGLRSTELAIYARITKQSMGYLESTTLSSGGYVSGRRTQAICGRKSFCLTPLGWKASQTIRATVLEVEADWARRIGLTAWSSSRQSCAISLPALHGEPRVSMVVAVVLCANRRFAGHNDRDLTEVGRDHGRCHDSRA